MLNLFFNTLFTITHIIRKKKKKKKKKKKRKNNVWTFKTIFAVGHPSSS